VNVFGNSGAPEMRAFSKGHPVSPALGAGSATTTRAQPCQPGSGLLYIGVRKTKIICTLGPATESPEKLREMVEAGANIFRLNMSHAPHEWVRKIVPRIRAVARELDCIIGILMDTQGPAIRTGDLPTKIDLPIGAIFEFTVRGEKSVEERSVDVNYDGFIDDINVGDTVLVDNGVIHMKVLEKKGNRVRCQILTPGVMGSRRHINLPGVKVNLPPLTE
jgi:pyruvate kinase